MQGWERAIYTLSVQRTKSHNTNPLKERRERVNSRRQNGSEQLRPVKNTWIALTRLDLLKIQSLWEVALETERRCYSKVMESNVTPNTSRSSDSFSTVQPVVNGGDWGPGPWDYHSLSLTRIQFHPPKVTILTNLAMVAVQRLCYCNSNAELGMAQQITKWSHLHNRLAYSPEWIKAPRYIGETITNPKHSPVTFLTQR